MVLVRGAPVRAPLCSCTAGRRGFDLGAGQCTVAHPAFAISPQVASALLLGALSHPGDRHTAVASTPLIVTRDFAKRRDLREQSRSASGRRRPTAEEVTPVEPRNYGVQAVSWLLNRNWPPRNGVRMMR